MATIRFRSTTPAHAKPHAGWHWTEVWRRMTPGNDGRWGDLVMVTPEGEADWTVIINHILGQPDLETDRSRAILLQTEAEVVRSPAWGEYHYPEDIGFAATWTIRRHHFPLDWYLLATYAELKGANPQKTKLLSACQTTKAYHPGHKLRMEFATKYLPQIPEFELYGWPVDLPCYRRKFPMRAKDDSLFPYKYHFCSENDSEPHYFTEKLGDAFLAECLPFYWGCPDLADFFPPESFIRLPLEQPERALEIVIKAMADGEWEKRLPAIREAKRRVLDKYQVWPILAGIVAGLEGEPI